MTTIKLSWYNLKCYLVGCITWRLANRNFAINELIHLTDNYANEINPMSISHANHITNIYRISRII